MLDAHMDEVGVMLTGITDEGFLSFTTVGGIEETALVGSRVKINGLTGVIALTPVQYQRTSFISISVQRAGMMRKNMYQSAIWVLLRTAFGKWAM